MLRFLKKRQKYSRNPAAPENPTHQITSIGTEHGRDSGDINRVGGSLVANQDGRAENKQPPAPSVSTPTPGQEGTNATPQVRGQIDGVSGEAPSEQLGRNTPDLSETARGCPSGGGQDGGGTRNLDQSGGSRVKGRDWVDRALGRAAFAVDLAKGPAEAFTPLKAILASISVVYAQYQKTVAVQDKIEILHSRIARLEKLFERSTSDEKETKLREGLLTKLKGIEGQLRSFHGKFVLLRLADNVQDSEDVSGFLEDLQEAVNDYMMVQQMAIYDQGCELMDAATSAVLNNFRSANGAEYRHGERKGCLRGTRGAVLNEIELWAGDFDRSPVYWLNGLAGTGKSTIAKTVAERLFVDGLLGASFFCSRDSEDRRNLQLIFPTLATQLARKYIEFRSILTPLIRSDSNIAYESLYNQMKKLIVEPLNRSSISTVIIIDALDECEDDESASAILSVLGRLVPKIPRVKFFLTGRPESRISVGFRLPLLAKMTNVFVLHNVEPDQVDSDIRLLFKSSFSELADRRHGLDNWPTGEQLDYLCERTAGLFVYAAATIKFIDNNKWDPRKRLNTLLESQKIGDHEGRSLDSLYTSILREAFGDDRAEDDAKTRSVLGAVVLATNPLSPSAIATLLGFDPEDVPSLLSSVGSLLVLQEDVNYPVRSFHKSFPDFVTNPARCTNLRFHISPPDHHAQLLIGCLGLMNRTLEKNMCQLPDGVANSDINDLKGRAEKYVDPALRYACVSWHTHLADADTIPAHTPTITPTLHEFLETKFLFWLEVLSVLGAVSNAVEALQVSTDWLEESPTLDLASDCFCFVTGYFEIISASSPHIYHSALAAAPKNSILRKLYESHARPFTRVVRGVPTSWGANTAATARPSTVREAARSPCDRFIAISWDGARMVDVLDSATLQRLQTLEPPQGIFTNLRAFIFSPDGRILTCSSVGYTDSSDQELCVVSWDLQTGGVASVIRWKRPRREAIGRHPVSYLANGKMVGVCYYSREEKALDISIFDVASGVHMHSHSFNDITLLSDHLFESPIWNHGESLRFATADATTITIWEVGSTSGTTATEVETLPAPDGFDDERKSVQVLLSSRRLALAHSDRCQVLVWDGRNPRYLLDYKDAKLHYPRMFLSSDGRFFACSTTTSDFYLWKESPSGYVLHGTLTPSVIHPRLLLTPNGESIVAFGGCTIQLLRTKSLTTPPSTLTRAPRRADHFILEFSPDGLLAVAAMRGGNIVMALNLKSGVPQFTIDAGVGVCGLGVIGNAVVVIGDWKVITWDLPAGDCVPGTRVGLEDNSWTINLTSPRYEDVTVTGASISSDLHHIVLATVELLHTNVLVGFLHVYCASTGEHLGKESTWGYTPRFSLDGCGIWCASDHGEVGVWRVGGKRGVLELLESTVDMEHPPEGNPWGSSHGYRITNDWWILGPDGRRLLMLPPPWQSYAVQRIWRGQFLALLHGELSEPVILELEVNSDL